MVQNAKDVKEVREAILWGGGAGLLGGFALIAIYPEWTIGDILLGPIVGGLIGCAVHYLHKNKIVQIVFLGFLGGLGGRPILLNLRERALKNSLKAIDRVIQEKTSTLPSLPPAQQEAAVREVIAKSTELMEKAASLRDRRDAQFFSDRLAGSTRKLELLAQTSPEIAVDGVVSMRAAASVHGDKDVWFVATESLNAIADRARDEKTKVRVRRILAAQQSPFR